jgi:hypothetical protein
MTIPMSSAQPASIEAASPSALTPLMVYASLAIVAESTPGEFSLSSNQPMCLAKMLAYSYFLIFRVTFSPMTPKENFWLNPVKKDIIETMSISKHSCFESLSI